MNKSTLSLEAHFTYQDSEFDYRHGNAELNLDGYETGLGLTYQPNAAPMMVNMGVSYAQLKGRDFVDHLTGTTGLTEQ